MKTTHNNTADAIGDIRAEIAELQAELKASEQELKDLGPGTYEGNFFRVTVGLTETARVNWKAVAAKLEPSRQLVAAHTTRATGVRLTITARSKAAA